MMTNFHELSVIKRNNFNMKIFLINNGGYMSIRNSQKEFFQNNIHGTNYQSGIYIPNIHDVAKFFNIKYYKCITKKNLSDNFKKEINYKRPVIFDCHSMNNQKIIPSIKSKIIKGKLVSQPLDKMYPYID